MNKTIIVALSFALAAFSGEAMAQPFTAPMQSDAYGTAQGGGNDPSIATPRDDNDGTPGSSDINDDINHLLGTNYAHNSDVDFLRVTTPDNSWKDLSTEDNRGVSILVGYTAANRNTLEVYNTSTPSVLDSVIGPVSGFGFAGSGTSSDPYPAGISNLSGGDFGWHLSTENGEVNEYDSNAALNDGGFDHMLTYHLADLSNKTVYIKHDCDSSGGNCVVEQYTFSDPYLLAWEDKAYANGTLGDEDYDDLVYLVDRVAPQSVVPEPMTFVLLAGGLLGTLGIRRRVTTG